MSSTDDKGDEPPSRPTPSRLQREDRKTVALDPHQLTASAWPLAITTLERLNGWALLAMRLGTLALLQECVREMALPNASEELVERARELVEALAHMPWNL